MARGAVTVPVDTIELLPVAMLESEIFGANEKGHILSTLLIGGLKKRP